MENHHQIPHIRIILGSKFQFQQTILVCLFFFLIYAKKESYRSKLEKMNVTIESFILEGFCFGFSEANLLKMGVFDGRYEKSASPLNCVYSN